MQCPVCTNKEMTSLPFNGKTIDRCVNCAGVFIAETEMLNYASDATLFKTVLTEINTLTVPMGQWCGHCSQALRQGRSKTLAAVVTLCTQCDHIWVEAHTFRNLESFQEDLFRKDIRAALENATPKAKPTLSSELRTPSPTFGDMAAGLFRNLSQGFEELADKLGSGTLPAPKPSTPSKENEALLKETPQIPAEKKSILPPPKEVAAKVQPVEPEKKVEPQKPVTPEKPEKSAVPKQPKPIFEKPTDIPTEVSVDKTTDIASVKITFSNQSPEVIESRSETPAEKPAPMPIEKPTDPVVAPIEPPVIAPTPTPEPPAVEKPAEPVIAQAAQPPVPVLSEPKPVVAEAPTPVVPKPATSEPQKTPVASKKGFLSNLFAKKQKPATPKTPVPAPIKKTQAPLSKPVQQKPILPTKPMSPAQPATISAKTAPGTDEKLSGTTPKKKGFFGKLFESAPPPKRNQKAESREQKTKNIDAKAEIKAPIHETPAPTAKVNIQSDEPVKQTPAPISQTPVAKTVLPTTPKKSPPRVPSKPGFGFVNQCIRWMPTSLFVMGWMGAQIYDPWFEWQIKIGIAFIGVGVGQILRLLKRYPFGAFNDVTVSDVLEDLKKPDYRGIPVLLKGKVSVDKTKPTQPIWRFEDATGSLPFYQPQSLELLSKMFGVDAPTKALEKEVVLKGWARSYPSVSIDVQELRAEKYLVSALTKTMRWTMAGLTTFLGIIFVLIFY